VNVHATFPRDLAKSVVAICVSQPSALLEPQNFERYFLSMRTGSMRLAHLDAGWQYTMRIPRLKFGCGWLVIWPIWIGLMTITRFAH